MEGLGRGRQRRRSQASSPRPAGAAMLPVPVVSSASMFPAVPVSVAPCSMFAGSVGASAILPAAVLRALARRRSRQCWHAERGNRGPAVRLSPGRALWGAAAAAEGAGYSSARRRRMFASWITESPAMPASRRDGVSRCFNAWANSMTARATLRIAAFCLPSAACSMNRSRRCFVFAAGGGGQRGGGGPAAGPPPHNGAARAAAQRSPGRLRRWGGAGWVLCPGGQAQGSQAGR